MLENAMSAIREFHYVMGVSPCCEFPADKVPDVQLSAIIKAVSRFSNDIESKLDKLGPQWLRIHLISEEYVEFLDAVAQGDKARMLDALSDLAYVIIGTGVQFNLPLSEAFTEIHRSNMTKRPRAGARLRDKGDAYEPPRLAEVLERHEGKWRVGEKKVTTNVATRCPDCSEVVDELITLKGGRKLCKACYEELQPA